VTGCVLVARRPHLLSFSPLAVAVSSSSYASMVCFKVMLISSGFDQNT
jgi:hypothetical protein